MCGIVGLFLKNEALQGDLGRLTSLMMCELRDRGPDSAGFAVYGREESGATKICMVNRNEPVDWNAIAKRLGVALSADVEVETLEDHAILRTSGAGDIARKWPIAYVHHASV